MGHSLGRGEEGRRPGRRISEQSHGWIRSDLVLVTWNRPCDARGGSEERVGGQWRPSRTSLLQLLHPVERAAGTEPLDLGLVEGVVQEDGLLGPVGVLNDARQRL